MKRPLLSLALTILLVQMRAFAGQIGHQDQLPFCLAVEQGQSLYLLLTTAQRSGQLFWETPTGDRQCQQWNGVGALSLTFERSGTLFLVLETREAGHLRTAAIDWFLTKSDEPLSALQARWLAAFSAITTPSTDGSLSEPGPTVDAFARAGFYREADTSALFLAERHWDSRQRKGAREQLLQRLSNPDVGTDPMLEAQLLLRLGEMETHLDYFSAAVTHLERAALLFHQLGMPLSEASAHFARGNVHTITGDLELAETAFGHASSLFAGDPHQRMYTQLELGWLARRRGHYDQAIEIFNELERRAENAGDLYLQMETNDRLGSTLGLAGRYAEGEAALRKSGQLIDAFDGDRTTLHGINFLNLAYLYRGWNKLELALESADRALALYSKDTYQEGKVTLYWTKGCVLRDLDREQEALEQFDLCLSQAEALRARSGFGPEGVVYFQYIFHNLEDVFHLCWNLHQRHPESGYGQQAFLFMERLRARGLAEVISPKHKTEAVLDQRLQALVQSAKDEVGPLLIVDPKHLTSADQLLAQVQKHLLGKDRGLIAYFLGERASYWFLLTPEGLEMGLLPPRAELEGMVLAVLETLNRPRLQYSGKDLLDALSRHLLPRPERIRQFKQLYLLLDGELNRLPFALLNLPKKGKRGTDRLIRKTSVALLSSASFGLALHHRNGRAQSKMKGLLVMADPVFNTYDSRLEKCHARTQESDVFVRLPFSGRELTQIQRLIPQLPIQGYRGLQATRTRFLAQPLADFRLIHLATHALCIPEQLGLSGLVFGMYAEDGSPQKAYLTSAEIKTLKLQADLVVLSACSGADGPLYRGEGLLGLAQAFMEAGACAVLASLWDVDDAATATLMNYFYQALAKGQDSARALRTAQIRMARKGAFTDPKYWAGFCLIGDSRKIF